VSGGSLGIAAWLAAREKRDLNPQARLELISKFLGSDFLSPVLGGFLFLDVPRLLFGPIWPSARRDHVFEKALADQWELIGYSDFFARPMLKLCLEGFRVAPAVFFNATDAQTGRYFPLTTALLPSQNTSPGLQFFGIVLDYRIRNDPTLENTSLAKATVAQMVSISARFPYLSPEAPVGIDASALPSTKADQQLEAEGLWSRLVVLVDGGYFDNTGLTPTNEALFVIEKRLDEERKKTDQNGPRPFTQAFVRAVHISNDPGTPCFALPEGWKEQASPAAKRFLAVAGEGARMRCKRDLAALESSLKPNPFFPIIAPLQSLLAVRVEHSRQALGRLRATLQSRPGYDLLVLDLASALEDAYGAGARRAGHSEEEMLETATEMRLRAERVAAAARDEIERSVQDGDLSRSSAEPYLKTLLEWRDAMRESLQVQCHTDFDPDLVAPPLGWTLSKSNQALMRCLSIRQGFSERFVLGSSQFLIDPPSYPSFRWKRERSDSGSPR
jgi:hypothetical protein